MGSVPETRDQWAKTLLYWGAMIGFVLIAGEVERWASGPDKWKTIQWHVTDLKQKLTVVDREAQERAEIAIGLLAAQDYLRREWRRRARRDP
jgi:hypothetical protein